jgi:hypothetical protein
LVVVGDEDVGILPNTAPVSTLIVVLAFIQMASLTLAREVVMDYSDAQSDQKLEDVKPKGFVCYMVDAHSNNV